MKVRERLTLFSAAQLLLFGCILGVGYCTTHRELLPMIESHLRSMARSLASQSASDLDVALGADDPARVRQAVAPVLDDPDFRYLEVQDNSGHVAYTRGAAVTDPFVGEPTVVHEGAGLVRVWMPVTFEGIALGRVSVVLDTDRIEHLRTGFQWLGMISLIVWLGALAYSFVFARGFVRPIREMKDFSKLVAAGDFDNRLAINSTGELRELSEYLNSMTSQLAHRDAERKATAARTEEMQRELLVLTRLAGMTEVATGVLHDVGNVLNSLNVSVSLVDDQLKTSKVTSLSRAVKLYDHYPGGLAGFLTTERGAALPSFLASVSECLVDENTRTRSELGAVLHNVEHIKSIVATQQTLVRVVGVYGAVDVREVVDAALDMSKTSFAKHRIEVVRDYAEIPMLQSDRHKLLQIVMNIVSNARDAMRDSERERRLTVRVRSAGDGAVIELEDTGVGVDAGDLDRVFRHGFTTKQDGHGFGLHTSANHAQQLGGSIRIASAGVNRGATVTIELPSHPPEIADAHIN